MPPSYLCAIPGQLAGVRPLTNQPKHFHPLNFSLTSKAYITNQTKTLLLGILLGLLLVVPLQAQPTKPAPSLPDSSDTTDKSNKSAPSVQEKTVDRLLQSNEFLVEVPWLQDKGEVQHTFSFTRANNGQWASRFSQEWALFSDRHQLAISMPSQLTGEHRSTGDVELTYKFLLRGNSQSRFAVAPGINLLLPTGSVSKETGAGAAGIGFIVPASLMLSKKVAWNSSAGLTWIPTARNEQKERAALKRMEVGQGIVWFARPRLNLLMEAKWEHNQAVIENKQKETEHEVFASPGIRWAHLAPGGVAIMPGLAFPIGVGPSRGQWGIMLFLSIEHSFKRKHE